MWKFAAELSPLACAAAGLTALASLWVGHKARETWFILVVAAAVVMALASSHRRRGRLVVRVGHVGILSFQPKHAR
jgi:hypothetical protein